MSSRRLMKELKRLQEDPPAGISAAQQDNNMMLWNAVVSGPEDTPWDGDGKICLDILQDMWCPLFHLSSILTSIQSLLCDPNPDEPINSEAAQLFNENKRLYNRKVREIVEDSRKVDGPCAA